jgi:hypothetical protein
VNTSEIVEAGREPIPLDIDRRCVRIHNPITDPRGSQHLADELRRGERKVGGVDNIPEPVV